MIYEVRFLSKELENEYTALEKSNPRLHKAIKKGIEKLKMNRLAGRKIPREQVSKRFVRLYGTTNFWKLDLSREWRLIYTIAGDSIRILSIILCWFDSHKQYEKEVYI